MAHVRFNVVRIGCSVSRMHMADDAALVDDVRRGHSRWGVPFRHALTARIVDNSKAHGCAAHKARHVGLIAIDVHTHDDKVITEFGLETIEERNFLPARSAPRCPKVDEDHLSAEIRKANHLTVRVPETDFRCAGTVPKSEGRERYSEGQKRDEEKSTGHT